MSSAVEFWQHVENTFWWFWAPILVMSCTGLYYMAQLRAAQSPSGIVARILLLNGFLCMIASFAYDFFGAGRNGITRVGLLLIMAAMVLIVRQFAMACKERRRHIPVDGRFGKRVLAALVDH